MIAAVHRAAATLARRATEYFDRHARVGRKLHGQAERAAAAREWMKLSARLLRVLAWTQDRHRVRARGGPPPPASDAADVEILPAAAQALIGESAELYARAERIEMTGDGTSPARDLQDRLRGGD